MRWAVFCHFAIAGLAGASSPAAESAFEAEVIGNNVFAHSGPGGVYYPTSLLRAGQIVTVVGDASRDWLAILPPRESFSWIARESVQENSDGTATVLLDETQVRVGSALSDARHVHQVVLRKGDRVQIVDEQVLAGRNGPERWYKIVPPAGERRYVPAHAVRIAETGARFIAGEAAPPPYQNISQPLSGEPIAARAGARVIPPAEPLTKGVDRPKGPAPQPGEPAPEVARAALKDDPTKSVAERASALKRQMEEMRTRRPEEWQLDLAKRLLSEIESAAKTDAEKEAVRDARQLEQQMRGLWDRYAAVTKRREVFLQQDRELSQMLRQTLDRARGWACVHDAEGTLRRSPVSIDRQLTYLLEDVRGVATHYVVFPAGLSGENYVGRRVGLLGKVSRREHAPLPRIDVEQATPLD
jgi:hypothetical protein